MAFRRFVIHYIAECEDCDWGTEDYLYGQKKASEHARKHGHKVRSEVGHCCVYDGRKGAQKVRE